MEVVISIEVRASRCTPAHAELDDDGPDLAVTTQVGAGGDLYVHVTFRAPTRVALSYESVREALALLVDAPDLGLTASDLLQERGLHRSPPARSWLGPPAEDEPGGSIGGWVTAMVRLDPPPAKPTTLYVRAALRDQVSAPVRVEVAPRDPTDEDE
jgi:hypothetical protein